MRCGGYECKKNEKERDWIPDQVGNDRKGCGVSPLDDERECSRGFAPARRGSFALLRTGSFVSAKGSKTRGARARPFGCLCLCPEWFGLRNSLRSNSPRLQLEFGTAAQPRLQAPSTWRHGWRCFLPSVIPGSIGDRGSLLLPVFAKRTTLDPLNSQTKCNTLLRCCHGTSLYTTHP